MLECFIIVETPKERDLLDATQQLANLYVDSGFTEKINIYRRKDKYDSFVILFQNLPDFDRFSYFVNFIRYPFDLDKFEPIVKGYYKTSNIQESLEFKTGVWVMLFITEKYADFDEITLVNEKNETYNYDFGGRVKKLNKHIEMFKFNDVDLSNYLLIRDIYPVPEKENSRSNIKPWWKFW